MSLNYHCINIQDFGLCNDVMGAAVRADVITPLRLLIVKMIFVWFINSHGRAKTVGVPSVDIESRGGAVDSRL